jgi:hypothetical protein
MLKIIEKIKKYEEETIICDICKKKIEAITEDETVLYDGVNEDDYDDKERRKKIYHFHNKCLLKLVKKNYPRNVRTNKTKE